MFLTFYKPYIFTIIVLFKELKNNIIVVKNIKCKMCNISDFLIDKDYQICHGCYRYYEVNNPRVLKDFEEGSIVKVEKKTIPCINICVRLVDV